MLMKTSGNGKAKRCVMLFEAGHLPLSRAPAIHLLWVSTAASRRRMRPLFANGGRVAVEGGQGRPGGPPEGTPSLDRGNKRERQTDWSRNDRRPETKRRQVIGREGKPAEGN